MLGGLDPIILIQIFKLLPDELDTISKIPVVSDVVKKFKLLPIPIYLSEDLFGLLVDSEEKSIEIETKTETLPDGADPETAQKGLSRTTKINIIANKNSLGVILLSSLMDIVYEKATSREYSITYLHGAITIFDGLLHSYSVTQDADSEKLFISIELNNTTVKKIIKVEPPFVERFPGAVPNV